MSDRNIYDKLQSARLSLQGMTLKKSGHNKFAGYQYFELADFLPQINKIFHDLKLCSIVSFSETMAELRIVNSEKPEEVVVFTSPLRDAILKGCHPIQNLGASETYSRRYLYVTALEIVEHDALDASQPVSDDFISAQKIAIDSAESSDALKAVWQGIVKECKESKDTEAYSHLKKLVTERGNKLKEAK